MKFNSEAITEHHEAELIRGVLISKLHCHIGRVDEGKLFDLPYLRQLAECKDNAARRILLGVR